MNIAIILASGIGSRIKQSNIPKQFVEINNKPIVAYTIERFIYNKNIDKVIVVCHPEWIDYLSNYVNSNYNFNNIYIIDGGQERNESIANAIKFLEKELKINNDDIVLTHDAVRMFVSDRIIDENIEVCKKHDAVTTAVSAIDTIGIIDNNTIVSVPNRQDVINIQTPQTFKFYILKNIFKNYKVINTSDICYLFKKNNIDSKIYIVCGDYENFKITTDFDLNYIKNIL